jgi:hypothetical protein
MTRFSSRLVLFVVFLTLACVSWVYVERYRGFKRLHGRLQRVEIQFDCWGLAPLCSPSPWRGKWVGTDDPVFLARVEGWLRALQRPACCNALRERGGRILLTFKDGRQEEVFFRGPDRPGMSFSWCSGFIWDGLDVVGGVEPFTEFLRDLGPES